MRNANAKRKQIEKSECACDDTKYAFAGKKNKLSRKQFFQRIGLASLLPFSAAWYSASERQISKSDRGEKLVIPADIAQGITFMDSIIVDKRGDDVNIYSSKCTHLGCRINKVEENELVCPCHGSRFAYNGSAIKGPASNPLQQLPFTLNRKTGEITVNVPV